MNFLKNAAACALAIMTVNLVGNIAANIQAERQRREVLRIITETFPTIVDGGLRSV